jgi:hypothetical protein
LNAALQKNIQPFFLDFFYISSKLFLNNGKKIIQTDEITAKKH